LITVVTVVFNGRRHIEQAIRSVIGQTYENIEYIVVDGGSTDGTLDILRKYEGRIDRIVSEPDRSIYDGMNKGIALSTGELVGFLNSDDWYPPGALKIAGEAYTRGNDPGAVVAGAWNLVFEDLGMTIKATPSLKFRAGMPLSHQAMFVPKRLYDSIGGYNLRYRYAADLDFALRLFKGGTAFHFVDDVLVNFRTSGASEKHYRESGKEASEIVRKHLSYGSWLCFKLTRFKFETLNALSRGIERFLGTGASGFLRKIYFRIKIRLSRNWEKA
jgi:glycosyltransferase involved in cell wall biosynthesis